MENTVYHIAFETIWHHYSMYFDRYSVLKETNTHRIGSRPHAKTLTNRGSNGKIIVIHAKIHKRGGNKRIAQIIIKLSTMLWWVVNIRPRLLYPEKELQINPAGM